MLCVNEYNTMPNVNYFYSNMTNKELDRTQHDTIAAIKLCSLGASVDTELIFDTLLKIGT